MNEELKTYILENMDEGTVIDFPEDRNKKERRKLQRGESSDFEFGTSFKKLYMAPMECLGIQEEKAILDEDEELDFDEKDTYLVGMNLDDYISDHLKEHSSFQNLLFKLIDERELTDPEVYNKVGISRKTFSKIRTDANYHPSKETVILFGLSLELSITEMEELLASASYALTRCDVSDLIVRFALHKEIYDVFEINEMLDEYNCKLLGV